MTIEEKRDAIKHYCEVDTRGDFSCYDGKCPLFDTSDGCYETNVSDEIINRNYEILFGTKEQTPDPTANPEPTNTTNDIINHPSHYCREDAMESIDEMVLVFGRTAVMHFCLCNCWKYRYRASSKNGEEDLKKSDWYMKKYKELFDEAERH